ncbi:hypothetical protein V6N12_022934 [Hibiscus sabdariffa]|uniref:Peroxin-13 n=1 Tax=Hibiscus sabdariffa TaxID=183260 RepID=A0ABR2FW93_9ROSI
MGSISQQQATGGSPPKPWEQAGGSSGSGPFKPPSPGSTSDVVEASGTARPGEIVSTADATAAVNRNAVARPLPSRPWEQQNYGNTYGGYGSGLNYNSGYGSGMYGSSYGGVGSYGGGLYGNNMYRGGYGGLYGNSGMYGGGMYGGGLGGFGGQMGGYGMGMGPYGEQDPNNPFGAPPSPPGFWMSFLRVMQGVVNCFGRISILIDQNTQAFHLFMTALLQLFDRGGLLYGELARFVLRLLGIKTKPRKLNQPGPPGLPGPHNASGNQNFEGPKAAPSERLARLQSIDETDAASCTGYYLA